MIKLEGVGPIENRSSTDQLHHFVQFFLRVFFFLNNYFFLHVTKHAKRHNFYTNKFGAEIILPEKVRKLQENFILDKTA